MTEDRRGLVLNLDPWNGRPGEAPPGRLNVPLRWREARLGGGRTVTMAKDLQRDRTGNHPLWAARDMVGLSRAGFVPKTSNGATLAHAPRDETVSGAFSPAAPRVNCAERTPTLEFHARAPQPGQLH